MSMLNIEPLDRSKRCFLYVVWIPGDDSPTDRTWFHVLPTKRQAMEMARQMVSRWEDLDGVRYLPYGHGQSRFEIDGRLVVVEQATDIYHGA